MSVLVQVIAWKDSSRKFGTDLLCELDVKLLTHSPSPPPIAYSFISDLSLMLTHVM